MYRCKENPDFIDKLLSAKNNRIKNLFVIELLLSIDDSRGEFFFILINHHYYQHYLYDSLYFFYNSISVL